MPHILYVKNMVCPRCIKVVSEEIEKLGIKVKSIELGKVELNQEPAEKERLQIREVLQNNGFELLDDKKSKITERVKILVIEAVRKNIFSNAHINLSEYLSENMYMEYTHLSSIFSSTEGKTIERFLILQKIERIKELISYNELTIKEIADQMGYSSLQALSSQFKKETGITPTDFKKMMDVSQRKPISGL